MPTLPPAIPTVTRTPTLTYTATVTFTSTATATFTPTPTRTRTPTPTRTRTPRPTRTPTSTPTRTRTPTPTITRTVAPSRTPTGTAAATLTPETSSVVTPPATPSPFPTETATLSPTATLSATATPAPSPGPPPPLGLVLQGIPGANGFPTLADFWEGRAQFVVDVSDTGLPMGESDTLVMANGELWSYLHASARSAGVVDRCGDPAPFPGCTVIYRSLDGGRTFLRPDPPVCQFDCETCPCNAERDHTPQQQYPRVAYNGNTFFLTYEYLGRVRLRRSGDGLIWSMPEKVSDTGIWRLWLRTCRDEERIHEHPYVPYDYECLAGGPPGIMAADGRLYIFVGLGQNPGAMGCYVGAVTAASESFTRCRNNPLFVGAADYGPLEEKGAVTNPYFDFRTISSAEVQAIGDRFYMLYEGTRGPGPGDPGDTQFALGLARSATAHVDGPWEKFPGNPVLVDLPGNIGLGHADLVVLDGQTVLFTSLNGWTRSRLLLVWK